MYARSLGTLMRKFLCTILTVAVFFFVLGMEIPVAARTPDHAPKSATSVVPNGKVVETEANGAKDIVVTISSDATSFPSAEEVLVHMTFTNSADSPVKVLKWYLPMDGVQEPGWSLGMCRRRTGLRRGWRSYSRTV